jgi:hypothetical protein
MRGEVGVYCGRENAISRVEEVYEEEEDEDQEAKLAGCTDLYTL